MLIRRRWWGRSLEPLPPELQRPVITLGPTDSYAPMSDLDAALAATTTDPGTVERRSLALLVGTRYVAYRVGGRLDELAISYPVGTITVVDARPAWRTATVAGAVRFMKSAEVPFGVAGGWDMATYVRQTIPDVDLLLYGQRSAFGIA
jgi:hypothetical protein